MLAGLVCVALLAATTAQRRCPGLYFEDRYYIPEMLKEGLNDVRHLALNRNDNTVYFTFAQLSPVPQRELGFLNLQSRRTGVVSGLRNVSSVAIDQTHARVFVANVEGIYEVNKFFVPEKLRLDDDVRSLFFKNGLYYSNARREAFTFVNGLRTVLSELENVDVDDLILDDDRNMFFLERDRLFRVQLGTRAVNSHEQYRVVSFTTDMYYRPYMWTHDSVYAFNKYKLAWDRVARIGGVRALAFGARNEPLLVIGDALLRLNYNPEPCHEYDF